jgi:phage terminase small subunit
MDFLEDHQIGARGPIGIVQQLATQQASRSPTRVRKLPARGRPRNPTTPAKPRHHDNNVIMRPPKHLRASKSWWQSIVAEYALEQHQYKILLLACETIDRREEARAALKKFGMVYTDDKGVVRQRPEVMIERDSAAAFLRALRALNLESESDDKA